MTHRHKKQNRECVNFRVPLSRDEIFETPQTCEFSNQFLYRLQYLYML